MQSPTLRVGASHELFRIWSDGGRGLHRARRGGHKRRSRNDGRQTARGVKDSCISSDEWKTVREKRNKVVSGKAVVHVSYTAPQDGNSRTSELHFDGRDDAFYNLKAGDQIDILVSNDDPAKIIKG
jgi:hypothetical protein